MVHHKFTGIHFMDFHPLAGLASYALPLETSFKSSAAEGRKKKFFLPLELFKLEKKGEGGDEREERRRRKGGREEGKKEKEMRKRGNQ